MSIKQRGENNGFYGKHHSKSTIDKVNAANKLYRDKLTDDDKKEISKKLSISQKKYMERDPEKYKEAKRKACYASHKSQSKRYKKNKIEIIVENELKKRKLKFKYSVILGFKQFDFGNKSKRILIEVQGDYWHANPKIYEGKILTFTQKNKIIKDKEKAEFAIKHNMKLFYIWEQDILKNNFSILDEIKQLINDKQT